MPVPLLTSQSVPSSPQSSFVPPTRSNDNRKSQEIRVSLNQKKPAHASLVIPRPRKRDDSTHSPFSSLFLMEFSELVVQYMTNHKSEMSIQEQQILNALSDGIAQINSPSNDVPRASLLASHSLKNIWRMLELVNQTFVEEVVCPLLNLSIYVSQSFLKKMVCPPNAVFSFENIALPSAPLSVYTLLEFMEQQGFNSENSSSKNVWILIKPANRSFVFKDDFRTPLKELLARHPGLTFLASHDEFQERYVDAVIWRICFCCADPRGDGLILTIRDLEKGDLGGCWKELTELKDVNLAQNFFSYEHFYVVYCRFYDLDQDHNALINKEDFSKFDNYGFSTIALDRIFDKLLFIRRNRINRCESLNLLSTSGYELRAEAEQTDQIALEDFAFFLMCEEDRGNDRALSFWFKVVDVNGDGVISTSDMVFFYEEQKKRLETFETEPPLSEDVICQLSDMVCPKEIGKFTLADFKRRRHTASIFFSALLNVSKYYLYEQRDPFAVANEFQSCPPSWTDWDRFCAAEYKRIALEDVDVEEENDNGDMGGNLNGF